MSKIQKLIDRLLSRPTDFTWNELQRLLQFFGYMELKGGKTGGSRRKFVNESKHVISLHKPHPGTILKRYQIDQIIATLKERSKLS
jgi:hypothetical protein